MSIKAPSQSMLSHLFVPVFLSSESFLLIASTGLLSEGRTVELLLDWCDQSLVDRPFTLSEKPGRACCASDFILFIGVFS